MIELFDSMNKKKKLLTNKKIVNIYLCGPTVYNFIHIGNARPVVIIDVLHRLLQHQGYEINYVHNITDIDDKIINQALLNNVSEKEIVDKYLSAYLHDLKILNVLLPTKMPKVSDFIPEIIEFITGLKNKQYAYLNPSDHDVYFAIDKIKSYGQLSRKKITDLVSTKRINNLAAKNESNDFVLWKNTNVGINWSSPWNIGRPGWHTECVVFIQKLFSGQTIDVHAGGVDLKFPHHENERAQFLAYYDKELANIWWHNGHVNFNNEKMSKSLNNFILVKDFVSEHGAMVLRYLLLNHNHQEPINFSQELIVTAQATMKKYETLLQLWTYYNFINQITVNDSNKINEEYYQKIITYLSDNVDCTNTITLINYMVKDLNQAIKNNDFSHEQQIIFKTLVFTLDLLGFKFNIGNYSEQTQADIKQWEKLKKAKSFEQADVLRKKLQDLNVLPS